MNNGLLRYIIDALRNIQDAEDLGGICTVCEGSGYEPCLRCDGYGTLEHHKTHRYITCPDCDGMGHLENPCGFCLGSKQVRQG